MSMAQQGASTRARTRMQRVGAAVALLAVAMVAGVLTAGTAEARTDNKSKTILFVHGYNPLSTSTDCGGDFDQMISQLRSEGFTGSMVKVGWYSGDYNCNVNLHSYGSYGDRDSWRTIGKAFSWYVWNTYTSRGITVDVVGYSMGGLITRGAVLGSSRGDSGYAPSIDVEDEVTLGTPHKGAAWYSNLCLWGQCASMAPGSTDLNWLNTNGNPQGRYGTEWTNIGSYNDDVVPYASATSMSIPSYNKVVYSYVSHTGFIYPNYMHSSKVVTRAGYALAYYTW